MVVPSPVLGVTLCHPERDDDQGDERGEPRYRESQEQEACPFSLMDSCHGHGRARGDGERAWTWEPRKDERKAENGRATMKRRGKRKEKKGNKVVDTVGESMGTIDRASTMASSTRRATAKACPTLIVKALGQSVLVYIYLHIFGIK